MTRVRRVAFILMTLLLVGSSTCVKDFSFVENVADHVLAAISHPSVRDHCPSRVRMHISHALSEREISAQLSTRLSNERPDLALEVWKDPGENVGSMCPLAWLVDGGSDQPESSIFATRENILKGVRLRVVDHVSEFPMVKSESGVRGIMSKYTLEIFNYGVHDETPVYATSERFSPFHSSLRHYIEKMCDEGKRCDPEWVFVYPYNGYYLHTPNTPPLRQDLEVNTLFEKGETHLKLQVFIVPEMIRVSAGFTRLDLEIDRRNPTLTIGDIRRTMSETLRSTMDLYDDASNVEFGAPDETNILEYWKARLESEDPTQRPPLEKDFEIRVDTFLFPKLEGGQCASSDCGGTLGGIVVQDDSVKLGLSNAHVMCHLPKSLRKSDGETYDCNVAMSEMGSPNMCYAAVGAGTNGKEGIQRQEKERYGNIVAGSEDVAVATIEGKSVDVLRCGQYGIGPQHGIGDAQIGSLIMKYGQKTGMTHGLIYATSSDWIKVGEHRGWIAHVPESSLYRTPARRAESLKRREEEDAWLSATQNRFLKEYESKPEGFVDEDAEHVHEETGLRRDRIKRGNYRTVFYMLQRVDDFNPNLEKQNLYEYGLSSNLKEAVRSSGTFTNMKYGDTSFGWAGDSGSIVLDVSTVPGRRLAIGQLSAGQLAKRYLSDGEVEFSMLSVGFAMTSQLATLNAYKQHNQDRDLAQGTLAKYWGVGSEADAEVPDLEETMHLCHSLVVPTRDDISLAMANAESPSQAAAAALPSCKVNFKFNPRSSNRVMRDGVDVPGWLAGNPNEIMQLMREVVASRNSHADSTLLDTIEVSSPPRSEVAMLCGETLTVDNLVTRGGAIVDDGFVDEGEWALQLSVEGVPSVSITVEVKGHDSLQDVMDRIQAQRNSGANVENINWKYISTRSHDIAWRDLEVSRNQPVANVLAWEKHTSGNTVHVSGKVVFDKCPLVEDDCVEGKLNPNAPGSDVGSPECSCSCPEAWENSEYLDHVTCNCKAEYVCQKKGGADMARCACNDDM